MADSVNLSSDWKGHLAIRHLSGVRMAFRVLLLIRWQAPFDLFENKCSKAALCVHHGEL